MKLFETSKGLKKKLTEAAKDVELPNSNLYLLGLSRDTNGNSTIKYFFPNQRAFSVQVYGETLKKSQDILKGVDKLDKLKDKDLEVIEKEITDYIKKFGSSQQKSSLKTYGKLNEADDSDKISKKYQALMKKEDDAFGEWQVEINSIGISWVFLKVRKLNMEKMSIFQDYLKEEDANKKAALKTKFENLEREAAGILADSADKRAKIDKKYESIISGISAEQNRLMK